MVSTRHHPKEFPPPDLSPSKASSRALTRTPDPSTPPRPRARSITSWTHTVSPYTLAWLCISLPLVIWDTGYVLGRPHTMPQGKWHAPLWKPYALYVDIDDLYGFHAWNRKDGFTAAQGTMNLVETAVYLIYAYLVATAGRKERSWRYKLVGREAALAVLVGFVGAVMTVSKTLLYVLVGYWSGWPVLRENNWSTIVGLWVIPNGAWIVVPSFMGYMFGSEILNGLEQAAGLPQKKMK